MLNNVIVHLRQHMFVDNPWILSVEHVTFILQGIQRKILIMVC